MKMYIIFKYCCCHVETKHFKLEKIDAQDFLICYLRFLNEMKLQTLFSELCVDFQIVYCL